MQGFSDLLGVVEIAIAVMICDALAIAASVGYRERAGDTDVSNGGELLIFDTRLRSELGRIPALAVVPGRFLLKDIVLLGASIWLLGQSLASIGARRS